MLTNLTQFGTDEEVEGESPMLLHRKRGKVGKRPAQQDHNVQGTTSSSTILNTTQVGLTNDDRAASNESPVQHSRLETSTAHLIPNDSDPYGLKVVHRPTGEPVADIVFVHGLGGHSCRNWSYNDDPNLFWPSAFLSKKPDIQEARIWSFGHNANFGLGSGTSELLISEFA